jgi:hypothetical protein
LIKSILFEVVLTWGFGLNELDDEELIGDARDFAEDVEEALLGLAQFTFDQEMHRYATQKSHATIAAKTEDSACIAGLRPA